MAVDLNTLQKATMKAPRILIHGEEGVGKTTFACGAPDVFLMDLEKGCAMNNPMLPVEPKSIEEVMDLLDSLLNQDNEYKTLVVDSLDVIERMITEKVCRENGWPSIAYPDYGKGYAARTDGPWKLFWTALDNLWETKNMIIILTTHSRMVKVEDPVLSSFDKFEPNLYKTEMRKAVDWPDIVGFCMTKSYSIKEGTFLFTKSKKINE